MQSVPCEQHYNYWRSNNRCQKASPGTAMRASSEKCLLSQSQNAKFGNIVPADKASRGVKHAMIKTKQNNVRHDFG